MPIGVPMATPSVVMISDPMMALSRPPPAVPGPGVVSVNTARFRPATPFHNSATRMNASHEMPNSAAPQHSVMAMALARRRREYFGSMA